MVIRALSDQHGTLPEVDPCDLLLIAGDISPLWNHDQVFQWEWIDQKYRAWLEGLPAKHIIGIAGNHDFILQTDEKLPNSLPWTYLRDSATVVEGLNVYGTPWVPHLPSWAFYGDDAKLQEMVDAIPEDVNILVTHGPPNGIGDEVLFPRGAHVGTAQLTAALQYRFPGLKLHVFGHIHESRGEWSASGDKHNWTNGYIGIKPTRPRVPEITDTRFANVTILNRDYEHRYIPMEFQLVDWENYVDEHGYA